MATVEELLVKLIVDTKDGTVKIQQIGQTVQKTAGQTEQSARRMSTAFAGIGDFAQRAFFTIQGFRLLLGPLNNAISRANEFEASTRKLNATAKLTGVAIDSLNKTATLAKDGFKLNTVQANNFTVAVTKLAQKAGDLNKTNVVLERLLDLGAAQGLDSNATLVAVNQAILGIDEGTDKLFQKNPSVLYDEFAKKIGTTAGKLNDQQKAQAILNAVVESGAKVQGEYNSFLASAAGKQATATAKAQEMQSQFGKLINQAYVPLLEIGIPVIQFFTGLGAGQQQALLGTVAIIGITPKIIASITAIRTAIQTLQISIGPAGWLAIGLGAVAIAFGLFSSGAAGATDAMAEFRKEISLLGLDETTQALAAVQKSIEFQEKLLKVGGKKLSIDIRAEVSLALDELKQKEQALKERLKFLSLVTPKPSPTVTSPGKSQQDAEKRLKELRVQNVQDEFEQRRKAVLLAFENESKDFAGHAEVLKELEIRKNQELAKINAEQFQVQAAQQTELTNLQLAVAENEIELRRAAAEREFADRRELAQGNAEEIADIERERLNVIGAIEQEELALKRARIEQRFQEERQKFIEQNAVLIKLEQQKQLALLSVESGSAQAAQIEADFKAQQEAFLANSQFVIGLNAQKNAQLADADNQFLDGQRQRAKDQAQISRDLFEAQLASARLFINALESGWDTLWARMGETTSTGGQKIQAVLETVKNSFIAGIGDMLKKFIAAKIRELTVHSTVEASKTAVTTSQTAARSGISLGAIAKEVVAVVKSIGTFLAQAAAKLASWFAALGPIGFVAGLAAIPALIAAAKAVIKNVTKFEHGGIAIRPTLGLIAESGSPEAAIPLNRKGADFIAQLIPKVVVAAPAADPGNMRIFAQQLAAEIRNIKIEIRSELDAIQFFRREFTRFQKIEAQRTLI